MKLGEISFRVWNKSIKEFEKRPALVKYVDDTVTGNRREPYSQIRIWFEDNNLRNSNDSSNYEIDLGFKVGDLFVYENDLIRFKYDDSYYIGKFIFDKTTFNFVVESLGTADKFKTLAFWKVELDRVLGNTHEDYDLNIIFGNIHEDYDKVLEQVIRETDELEKLYVEAVKKLNTLKALQKNFGSVK